MSRAKQSKVMNVKPTKVTCVWRTFLFDDRGAELVEWVLVMLAVGVIGWGTLVAVRGELGRVFELLIEDFVSWD